MTHAWRATALRRRGAPRNPLCGHDKESFLPSKLRFGKNENRNKKYIIAFEHVKFLHQRGATDLVDIDLDFRRIGGIGSDHIASKRP